MSDEQPPITPPPPYEPPPPPDHGPFAFPPPPEPVPTYGGPGAPAGSVFPLDIGRTFELTFSLYRNRWRTLVGIGLLVEAIVALASLALLATQQSSLISGFPLSDGQPTRAQLDAYVAALGPQLLLSLGFLAVAVIAGSVQLGAMTDAVGRIYAGRPVSASTSIKRGLSRWLTFLGVMVLLFLGVLAVFFVGAAAAAIVSLVLFTTTSSFGLAFFMILIVYVAIFAAFVFVAVRWSMAVQAIMLEGLGARAAMGRSWRLIAGSGWRVIGYYLAFALVTVVISLIIGTVVNLALNPYQMSGFRIASIDYTKLALATVLSALLGAFVTPLTAIPAVLLYLDLRFRHGDFINPPGQGSLTPSGRDGSVSE